jgi:hypothetical protein
VESGFAEVHTQPSNASSIYVKSSEATDTQVAYIEGIITGGYYIAGSVTLTGTTAVAFAASSGFIHISKFYLASAPVGAVTLHEDSGAGTELAKITPTDVRAQYHRFLLYPTPSAVVTYNVDVTRAVPEMSNDTDEPLLHEDFHDLLIDKAELKAMKKSDDPTRYAMLVREIDRAERDLVSWVGNHPDWTPPWAQSDQRPSSLGAWYPSGT